MERKKFPFQFENQLEQDRKDTKSIKEKEGGQKNLLDTIDRGI